MISKFSVLRNSFFAFALLLFTFSTTSYFVEAQNNPERSAQVKNSDSLTTKERMEVYEEVWETINQKYYDPKFNGVDWNAVREKYRPRVNALTNDADFYDLLALMVGELRDAHTRVRSPRGRLDTKKLQATSAGVRIYEVEGTPIVFSVAPDSEAARAGVTPGLIVRTVDGQPIAEAIQRVRQEIGTSSSERATRILSYSRLIAGEPDTPLKLGLTRADGSEFEVALTRRTISAAPQFSERLLPSGYAYIKFNRFLPPADKKIKEALLKYKDAPGLILDLRLNGGGDGELGLKIAGYFFNDKVPFGRIITRTGKPPSAFFGLFKLPKEFQAGEKGEQLYANPVVILINEATGSTSELFASALQEQNRAYVIGTQSCGCVLGVINHKKLKGGGELDVSEIGFLTSKNRTLEGNGVLPDKSVALTIADLQRSYDAALNEAENYLNNLLKKNKIE
jgi:carboxyl-terminal processing protease